MIGIHAKLAHMTIVNGSHLGLALARTHGWSLRLLQWYYSLNFFSWYLQQNEIFLLRALHWPVLVIWVIMNDQSAVAVRNCLLFVCKVIRDTAFCSFLTWRNKAFKQLNNKNDHRRSENVFYRELKILTKVWYACWISWFPQNSKAPKLHKK